MYGMSSTEMPAKLVFVPYPSPQVASAQMDEIRLPVAHTLCCQGFIAAGILDADYAAGKAVT